MILSGPGKQPLYIPNMAVSASVLLHQGFHALLGRDVLGQCILHYNGDGNFTLAF